MAAQPKQDRWIEVGRVDDIPRLGARVVQGANGNIAIFRTAGGEIFALADRCPHRGGPLSQGIVFGARVACPLHDWVIELASGTAVAPDVGCTERYDVRVQDGAVWLNLSPRGASTENPRESEPANCVPT